MTAALDRKKVRELLDLTSGDVAWVESLLGTYIDDTSKRLAELAEVTAIGASERIQRAAHGIKGSSSSIGAAHMAELCHEMETLAREGDLPSTRSHLALMQAEFEHIASDIPVALAEARTAGRSRA